MIDRRKMEKQTKRENDIEVIIFFFEVIAKRMLVFGTNGDKPKGMFDVYPSHDGFRINRA